MTGSALFDSNVPTGGVWGGRRRTTDGPFWPILPYFHARIFPARLQRTLRQTDFSQSLTNAVSLVSFASSASDISAPSAILPSLPICHLPSVPSLPICSSALRTIAALLTVARSSVLPLTLTHYSSSNTHHRPSDCVQYCTVHYRTHNRPASCVLLPPSSVSPRCKGSCSCAIRIAVKDDLQAECRIVIESHRKKHLRTYAPTHLRTWPRMPVASSLLTVALRRLRCLIHTEPHLQ